MLLVFEIILHDQARLIYQEEIGLGIVGDELVQLSEVWTKVVQLHLTLRTRPYSREGLW
jgi:hypothetical protein